MSIGKTPVNIDIMTKVKGHVFIKIMKIWDWIIHKVSISKWFL